MLCNSFKIDLQMIGYLFKQKKYMPSHYNVTLKNFFPSVTAHRLQNANNVTIGAINISS